MKKLLTAIICIATLYSCQKEDVITNKEETKANLPAYDLLKTWLKISQSANFSDSGERRLLKKVYTEWTTQMLNQCYPELVQIKGVVMWSGKTYEKDGLIYRIGVGDVRRVTGIGLTSGLIYKGAGESRDTTITYPDNSAVGYSSFNATWTTSQGNQIIFDEHTTYYFYPEGGGRITYLSQNDTCK